MPRARGQISKMYRVILVSKTKTERVLAGRLAATLVVAARGLCVEHRKHWMKRWDSATSDCLPKGYVAAVWFRTPPEDETPLDWFSSALVVGRPGARGLERDVVNAVEAMVDAIAQLQDLDEALKPSADSSVFSSEGES